MKKRIISRLIIVVLWVIFTLMLYNMVVLKKNNEEEKQEAEEQQEVARALSTLESIRVLIETTGYESKYHDKVVLSGTNGLEIQSEDGNVFYDSSREVLYDAGKLKGKVTIHSPNDGRVYIHSVERSEKVSYRGNIECYGTDKGIVIVNELPFEEYLYGVVPSEMPSSYPLEALKAQAITARTYALYHASAYAYPQWKAHVDDSTAYQVYLNKEERPSVIKAVDETRGMVITYDNEIVESFYYSTSSGCSTGYEAWDIEQKRDYFQTGSFAVKNNDNDVNINNLEAEFRQFIDYGRSSNIEYEEPWYRWVYKRKLEGTEDSKQLINHIYQVYKNNPDTVVISSNELEGFQDEKNIKSIEVTKRLQSGLVQELTITTDNYRIIADTQFVIRQILANHGDTVIKRDYSEYIMGNILPSAYFYIDTISDGNKITEITINGGGLGHGVGMSQNGAKCLANEGRNALEILKYYYKNVDIVKLI